MKKSLLCMLSGILLGNIVVISIMRSEKQQKDIIYEMGPPPEDTTQLVTQENDCCVYQVYRYKQAGKDYVRIVNIREKTSVSQE